MAEKEQNNKPFKYLMSFDDKVRRPGKDQIWHHKKDYVQLYYELKYAIEQGEDEKKIKDLYDMGRKVASNIKNHVRKKEALAEIGQLWMDYKKNK